MIQADISCPLNSDGSNNVLLCHAQIVQSNKKIISVLHIAHNHILHIKDDYDSSGKLKSIICEQLADFGIEHINENCNKDSRRTIQQKLLDKGILIKSSVEL